jgi:hypothetical protein
MSDLVAPVEPTDTEPVQPTPPVYRPSRKQSRTGTIALAAAALVAVAGLAFAGGRLTAPAAAATGGNGFRGGNFPFASFDPNGGFPGGGNLGGGLRSVTLRGQVTSASASSITIQLDTGSTVTLPIDSQTTYHKSMAGSSSDVAVGSTVVVEPGTTNSQPGASFNPAASPGSLNFGPAVDVTVVQP